MRASSERGIWMISEVTQHHATKESFLKTMRKPQIRAPNHKIAVN